MAIAALTGRNFSGRSARLRHWVGLPNDDHSEVRYTKTAYLGPDATSSLSGIAPTARTEIELLSNDRVAYLNGVKLMGDLGFESCLDQNPFTLSGGEQAALAIAAAVASRPKRIALDGCLEQLSAETRTAILTYLGNADTEILVADNRLADWYQGKVEALSGPDSAPGIDENQCSPVVNAQAEIEFVDLCHAYVKNRFVFKNLNFKLKAGVHYLLKGPNGAGKTTLSKILCGLIRPTSGLIKINGEIVRPWLKPGKFASYHFQNPSLQLFSTTVREELRAGYNAGTAKYFGVDSILDSHPLDLPYVLRKRIALVGCLTQPAMSLILDEPTLGQDDAYVNGIERTLKSVSGFTISHSKKFDLFPTLEIKKNG